MNLESLTILNPLMYHKKNNKFITGFEAEFEVQGQKETYQFNFIRSMVGGGFSIRRYEAINNTKNINFHKEETRKYLKKNIHILLERTEKDYQDNVKKLEKAFDFKMENLRPSEPVSYDASKDGILIFFTLDIVAGFEKHPVELGLISEGSSNVWKIQEVFFAEGRVEKELALLVTKKINESLPETIHLVEQEINEFKKKYRNKQDLIFQDLHLQETIYEEGEIVKWEIKGLLLNEKKYVKTVVRKKDLSVHFQKWNHKVNWSSDTWYPGWQKDVENQVKQVLA